MQFDFTVSDEAFAEKYRDRLHTLLQSVLTQNIFALEQHDIESTKVIRRGMDGDAVKKSYEDREKRREEHIRIHGTEQGFRG